MRSSPQIKQQTKRLTGPGALMRRGICIWLLYILLLPTSAIGQNRHFVRFVSGELSEPLVDARGEVVLHFVIEPGYHIQSVQPDDPYLIPTELSISASSHLEPGQAVFPEASDFYMQGVEIPLKVYDHEILVQLPVSICSRAQEGRFQLEGKLYYQACDSVKCFFPRRLSFEVEIPARVWN